MLDKNTEEFVDVENSISENEENSTCVTEIEDNGEQVADNGINTTEGSEGDIETQAVPFYKKQLGIMCITIAISMLILVIALAITSYQDKVRPFKECISEITSQIKQKNYYEALTEIKNYRETLSGEFDSYDEDVEILYAEIEAEIFNRLPLPDYSETIELCDTYILNYPDGQHRTEVEKFRKEARSKKATDDLRTGKKHVKNQEYYYANSKLEAVANNPDATSAQKQEAKKLLQEIKPMYLIEGKWTKATGVSYVFTSDGQMETELASNYNKAAGTTWDGLEVSMLLGDIEDFGRPVHGGRWEYAYKHTLKTDDPKTNGRTIYIYSLLYNGSLSECIVDEEREFMAIGSSNGIGDWSYLYR